MNYSTAVFLINPNVRAIKAIYELDTDSKSAPRTMFKTMDPTISVDDFVIVPTGTRHGMTVVKVVETDVEFDINSPTKIEWVVQTVDRAPYEAILKSENDAISQMKQAEINHQREELRKKMFANIDPTKLALARMSGPVIDAITTDKQ